MSGGVGPSETREKSPTRRTAFTFRHLIFLAVAIILAATGMISSADIAFVPLSIIYMYLLSKVAFPLNSPSPNPPVFSGEERRIINLYVVFAAVNGLFLPIAYISVGVLAGDKEGVGAAAPHLFLLASQCFLEGLAFGDTFSLPISVYVPVFYNSRRIFSITDWLRSEFAAAAAARLYVGRAIAVANMALWCFNLFGFLLPVYLPRAFKIYYSKFKD